MQKTFSFNKVNFCIFDHRSGCYHATELNSTVKMSHIVPVDIICVIVSVLASSLLNSAQSTAVPSVTQLLAIEPDTLSLVIMLLSFSLSSLCVAFLLANKAKVQLLSHLICTVVCSQRVSRGACVARCCTLPELCIIYLITHTHWPTSDDFADTLCSLAVTCRSPPLSLWWLALLLITSALCLAISNLRLSETITGGAASISDC